MAVPIEDWSNYAEITDYRILGTNEILSFDIVLNTRAIDASPHIENFPELPVAVMAHELGHVLGLRDDPTGTGSVNSLMNAHSVTENKITGPRAFDITSVSMIYG